MRNGGLGNFTHGKKFSKLRERESGSIYTGKGRGFQPWKVRFLLVHANLIRPTVKQASQAPPIIRRAEPLTGARSNSAKSPTTLKGIMCAYPYPMLPEAQGRRFLSVRSLISALHCQLENCFQRLLWFDKNGPCCCLSKPRVAEAQACGRDRC